MRGLFVKRGLRFSALEAPELKNPERELSHFRRRLIVVAALVVLGFAGLIGRFWVIERPPGNRQSAGQCASCPTRTPAP